MAVGDAPTPASPAHIADAVAALRRGELVVLPTETLYGVFADITQPGALDKLRAARAQVQAPADAPFTWHAAQVSFVTDLLTHDIHRHIATSVLPGPVRLIIEASPADVARVTQRVPPHALDAPLEGDPTSRVLSARVPSDATFAAIARECGVLVGERVGLIGLGDGRSLPTDAATIAARSGVGVVLDTGLTTFAAPSNALRLTRAGWYRIEGSGVWSERTLRSRFETQMLFVCTGNTCRSPMAEAIARHFLAKPGATKKPTRVASAGVATSDGLAMTPEAVEALDRLRIDPGRHRSRVLTREMVEDATVIYAMTRSHAQQAIALVPAAKDKIQLLDPSGRDITDPIGAPLATYVQTAEALANFIRTRFTADGTLTLPRKKGILEPG